jgi:hypothetical protein
LAITTGLSRSEFESAEDIVTAIEILEKRNGTGRDRL